MIKTCIVCMKEYEVKERGANKTRLKPMRSRRSYTCGRKCSKIYNRIARQVRRLKKDSIQMKGGNTKNEKIQS